MSAFCRCNKIAVTYILILFILIISISINAAEDLKDTTTLVIRPVPVKDVYKAMGTVRPLTESEIHSQISAKVIDVLVSAGDKVEKGQLLVRLDNREVTARLEQAKEGLTIAEGGVEQALKSDEELEAEYEQVESEYIRSSKLFKEGIHSKKDFDQAKTQYLKVKAQQGLSKERVLAAKAALRQAQQIVNEAEIFAEYANIKALNSGRISKSEVDPGDLATPSVTLLTIQTGSSLRLEAGIRESLIDKIKIGTELEVRVGSNVTPLTGTVEEIQPYADARTRSFLVKVGIPATPGVFPGMFGRLAIPLGTVDSILIPEEAVSTIGQLKTVNLLKDGKVEKIFVKTGQKINGKIEILSGLKNGDTISF